MKSILSTLLICFLPIICFSQKDKITRDTTIEKTGDRYKYCIIEYQKGIKIKEIYQTRGRKMMSAEELFQRGVKSDSKDYFFTIDSIKQYFLNGNLKYKYKKGKRITKDTTITRDTIIKKVGEQYKYQITVYQNGVKFKETYSTRGRRMMTREEMFMRGIRQNSKEYLFTIDSTKEYFENGNLRFIYKNRERLKQNLYYNSNNKLVYVEATLNGKQAYNFGENLQFSINNIQITVHEKYGQPIRESLFMINNRTHKKSLLIDCENPNVITTPTKLNFDSEITKEIVLSTKDNNIEIDTKLLLKFEEEAFPVGFKVIRYDLDDSDFHPTKKIAVKHTYSLSKNDVKLRLANNEKLALVYKGKKLILRTPISKIENRLDLSKLENGLYLLEIQDLGQQQSRYCQIKKE